MEDRLRRVSVILFLVLGAGGLFAQDAAAGSPAFRKGEELFMSNKPAEALPYLEEAAADSANITAGLYLAMSYEQIGRLDNAIAVYRRILPSGGEHTALIAFNLGNACYNNGTADFAEQYYTRAIEADPGYAPAYLNRANARIKTGAVKEAVLDYELYLALEPASPKRPQIERLISLVMKENAAGEQLRQKAETAVRADVEQRQRFLEEVSASFQAAAEEAAPQEASASASAEAENTGTKP
jgi:tetratricopeptide (TPR) repeat protein